MSNTMKVAVVTVRNVYGVNKIYPANDVAQVLADIAGTKTLERRVIKLADKLGIVTVASVMEQNLQLAKLMEGA